ncbi:uncharacterized protein LOC122084645 isoform X2 [Macadamia integrifolia]|uniref:uncharacterized protein LOC122084645 isoform X2 n=1 Tax=Macadamia integrifolia TaxID=60698 RepID=UPI001C4FF0ED|nr:uncharacterized protein LOC122084645 isoform X2 [Macadamia integrifolia]
MRPGRRIREGSWKSSPRPHFFKIIVKASLESEELIIPKEFTRQYAKKLADVAVLEVPTGRKWRVEVKKVDGSVRFQNGWRGFLEYHSISVGHFLLFRYDGKSTFSVFIFNQGACEIDYPSDTHDDLEESSLHTECLIPVKKEPEEEDPVEPLPALPSIQHLPSSVEEVLDKAQELQSTKRRGRPRKKRHSFQPLPPSAEEVLDEAKELQISKRGRPRKGSSSQKQQRDRNHQELRELRDGSGLNEIKVEEEPFCAFPSSLPLPSSAEEILDKAQELRISKRGRPRKNSSERKQTRNRKHQELRELGDGSGINGIKAKGPIFDAENEMEAIEVSSDNPNNETSMSTSTEDPVEPLSAFPSFLPLPSSAEEVIEKAQEQELQKTKRRGRPRKKQRSFKHLPFSVEKILDRAQELQIVKREFDDGIRLNGIKDKGPIFDAESEMEAIEVSSDNHNNETRMSTSTVNSSLSMDAQYQNTDADNSLPFVPLPSYGDASLRFNGSEPSAPANQVKSNCLEQECRSKDFTARDSTSAAEPGKHIDSSLTKHEENVSMRSSRRNERLVTASKRVVMNQQKEKAICAAQMFKTKNPSIMIIMKPSYVYKGKVLNFPKNFAKKYLNEGLHNVKVSVSDGRTWMVRCSINQRKAMITGGWAKFVRDNELKAGDCCVFEVSKAKGMELKISIFRVVEEAEPEFK